LHGNNEDEEKSVIEKPSIHFGGANNVDLAELRHQNSDEILV